MTPWHLTDADHEMIERKVQPFLPDHLTILSLVHHKHLKEPLILILKYNEKRAYLWKF